jgi:hypothetical protein
MKHRNLILISSVIGIILVWMTIAWSYGHITSLTANGLSVIWLIWLLWFNYAINETILEDKLVVEDKLLTYPWYRLALAGIWVIGSIMLFDSPITRLTWAFAVASVCLWRDHRWSAFLALDMLWVVIITLIIKEQWLADAYAIYLYYFLVIATLTMIVNNKKEETIDS